MLLPDYVWSRPLHLRRRRGRLHRLTKMARGCAGWFAWSQSGVVPAVPRDASINCSAADRGERGSPARVSVSTADVGEIIMNDFKDIQTKGSESIVINKIVIRDVGHIHPLPLVVMR